MQLWDSGEDFATVARLLHAADEDILEIVPGWIILDLGLSNDDAAGLPGSRTKFKPTQYQSWLDRGELLKQLGFQLDSTVGFIFLVMCSSHKIPGESLAAMLSVLFKLCGDVNSADKFGMQPLQWMMYCSSIKEKSHNFTALAIALLQNGADPCALNSFGRSTLDYAEDYGCTVEWYEAVEEAGFDIREVEREIEKRKWYYNNPDHGFAEKITALDEDDVAAPSTEGLSHRRAIVGDRLDD